MTFESVYKDTLELFRVLAHTEWGVGTFWGVLTAMAVSMLKKLHNKETIQIVESILCGMFTLFGALLLRYLEIPEYLGIALGGGIGWYGTAKVSEWLEVRIGLRVRGDQDETTK